MLLFALGSKTTPPYGTYSVSKSARQSCNKAASAENGPEAHEYRPPGSVALAKCETRPNTADNRRLSLHIALWIAVQEYKLQRKDPQW